MNLFEKNIISPEGEESRQGARESLEEWHKEGAEPLMIEHEKTELDIAYIKMVNNLILKTFDNLGIEFDGDVLNLDQLHILNSNDFREKFPHLAGHPGFYSSTDNAIYYDAGFFNQSEEFEEISRFEFLLHEALHMASHQKFYVKDKTIKDYRVGYRLGDVNERGRNFEGFNEGVLVLTEIYIMTSFADELEESFGFTMEQINGPIYGYHDNQGLVIHLASKIAEYRDEETIDSLERIMRGQFTGEMMHLRDIEEIFGKGSLKVLARFGYRGMENVDNLILDYFHTDNPQERAVLKKKILKES